MLKARITAIEYFLPEATLSNDQLRRDYPDWMSSKVEQKVGIQTRHIAGDGECSSDLAVRAAEKLFASGVIARDEVDYVMLCTQSPDYFLPTTACVLQERLQLPTTTGALDFNLGCSGFVYGLGMAKGLIETGQARNVLLLTAETYSKFIHPEDKGVRILFGDAAAATLVSGQEADDSFIGPFVYGTDGRGAGALIVPAGGMRQRAPTGTLHTDEAGNKRSDANLFMDGPAIFTFTLNVVPEAVKALLARAGLSKDDIDVFVFHQANRYMLDHLRKKLAIAEDRFPICMSDCGNTVSSTIPIALENLMRNGQLPPGKRVMAVGFGVGLSWGACLLRT